MAVQISEKTGMSIAHANRLLAETPRLKGVARTVCLGNINKPDVFVTYLRPEAAMKLLRRWQQMTGKRLATELSAFTAVCTSLVVAYQEGQPAFSFGCPDSREYGGIRPELMIAAIPALTARKLQERET
jgi:uncharacterized protein (DUF169 family)